MKKMKMLLLVFLTGVVLGGCTTSKLSESYDEELLKEYAQGIVNMICNDEYSKVIDKMSENLKTQINAEQLKEAWQPMKDKLGKFKSINKEELIGNEDLATVVEVVEFDNGKAQFTITYNEDMKLEGLYMK
ncbi:DUF3887 domain-containing protein [Romboutsia sp. 1001216sp1]|uniref:DUF3887 domain-containing protein n=1 Tax=unclassified Romboutsia TaxID=2626894 RepID=UPI0018A884EA|nr:MULTISPECIES: DUF3887 domain-containing protein [unclassified Romboutsia]MDB8793858.1 DUF3887 domain-containing protein [Romboutsia sp. 1001216sp1]MDB8796683.1 DUF3887 domain-containing protein [Romboutsia sp. 1001216sp1]MDB8799888.1 DUF3887 domain-containing protein [Romboutsia sp. 1001216sp1]